MRKLLIIADDREKQVIAEIKRICLDEQIDLNVIVSRLTVGDFVLSKDLVSERKRGDDFVNTFKDREREDEFQRIIETYPRYCVILEDFDMAFDVRNILPNNIYGMISKVVQDYRIPVIPTRDYEDTARLLIRMAIREQREKELPVIARHKPKFESFDDPDTSKRIQAIQKYQLFFIQGLIGVGQKMAYSLLQRFGTPFEIIKQYCNTPLRIINDKKKFAYPTDLSNFKGIGVASVFNNRILLLTDTFRVNVTA